MCCAKEFICLSRVIYLRRLFFFWSMNLSDRYTVASKGCLNENCNDGVSPKLRRRELFYVVLEFLSSFFFACKYNLHIFVQPLLPPKKWSHASCSKVKTIQEFSYLWWHKYNKFLWFRKRLLFIYLALHMVYIRCLRKIHSKFFRSIYERLLSHLRHCCTVRWRLKSTQVRFWVSGESKRFVCSYNNSCIVTRQNRRQCQACR